MSLIVPLIMPILAAVGASLLHVLGYRHKMWDLKLGLVVVFVSTFLMEGSLIALPSTKALSGFFLADGFAYGIALVQSLVWLLVLPAVMKEWQQSRDFKAVCVLFLLFYAGMKGLTLSNHLVGCFLFTEFMTFSGFALVAGRRSPVFTEAALKYLLMSSFTTFLFIAGVLLLLRGNFELTLPLSVNGTESVHAGILCLFFTYFFLKLGMPPFHFAAVDYLDGAPYSLGAFTFCSRFAILAFFFRFLGEGTQSALQGYSGTAIMAFAILGGILGFVGASLQSQVKRLLIYANCGEIVLILLVFLGAPSETLVTLLFQSFFMQGLCFCGLFLVLPKFERLLSRPIQLSDLPTLWKTDKAAALFAVLFLGSLAGVPLTWGFQSRLQLLQFLVQNQSLAVFVLYFCLSILGAFVYLRVGLGFFRNGVDGRALIHGSRDLLSIHFPAAILAVLIVFIGLEPSMTLNWIHSWVVTLFLQ